jgi:hypothetical protein
MRSLISALSLVFVAAIPAKAQDTAHARHKPAARHEMGKEHHMSSSWKEMNAFHEILSATFHPARDKKDFKPLRARSEQLAATARAWSASTAPAPCNTPELKSTVAWISTYALEIGNQVLSKASDEDLLKSITSLHDKFEQVEKGCH